MRDYENPLYDRRGKYQMRDAAKDKLGHETALALEYEWQKEHRGMVFGEFLHKQHPEIFAQLVAWMKIMGKW